MKSFQQYTEEQSASQESVQQEMQGLIDSVDKVNDILDAGPWPGVHDGLGQPKELAQQVWQRFSDIEGKVYRLKKSVERYLQLR